jgi:glutamate synthase (NADPH/NADH) small chain
VRVPVKTNKKIAVVGSGPAGLAAAQQLARRGHTAVLFEKSDRIGGLLRYGIPDFKLEKWVLDRRIEQMVAEGVIFEPNVTTGVDLPASQVEQMFDAVVITSGAGIPRDLGVPGRDLRGVHFAMDFLTQSNRRIAGDIIADNAIISAEGKDVVVIGGGRPLRDGNLIGAAGARLNHRGGERSQALCDELPEMRTQSALVLPGGSQACSC